MHQTVLLTTPHGQRRQATPRLRKRTGGGPKGKQQGRPPFPGEQSFLANTRGTEKTGREFLRTARSPYLGGGGEPRPGPQTAVSARTPGLGQGCLSTVPHKGLNPANFCSRLRRRRHRFGFFFFLQVKRRLRIYAQRRQENPKPAGTFKSICWCRCVDTSNLIGPIKAKGSGLERTGTC